MTTTASISKETSTLMVHLFSPSTQVTSAEAVVEGYGQMPLRCFDERTYDFLQALSIKLTQDPAKGRQPDIASLAFWIRKANLKRIAKENEGMLAHPTRRMVPLGSVFHLCPSNVDTMFLYSMCLSLLLGNKNWVRISRKLTPTLEYLLSCINAVVESEPHGIFKEYIKVFTYEPHEPTNRFFCQHADARVLWGGDEAVQLFRSFPSKPRCRDIVFPDRKSATIIQTEKFLALSLAEQEKQVLAFYNDAYIFDQKACSSPLLVLLLGPVAIREVFLDTFYSLLSNLVQKRYGPRIAEVATKKYNAVVSDLFKGKITHPLTKQNGVYMSELLDQQLPHEHCGGGYFYYVWLDGLEGLSKRQDLIAGLQTLTYSGFTKAELEKLESFASHNAIDRIVPLGQALNFHYIWDGQNLVEMLSRYRFVEA